MEVRREMEHKIFVSVQGGVAEVCEETVPAGIVVKILDFDNFAANPKRELSLWSPELREHAHSKSADVLPQIVLPSSFLA